MKKLFLLSFALIFCVGFVYAENCQLATPRYGVVQCINTGQIETVPLKTFSCGGDGWCSLNLPCLSNCQLIENSEPGWSSPIFWSGGCSFGYSREWEVILNERSLGEVSSTSWNRGDDVVINVGCKNVLTGSIKAPPTSTSIQYQQDKIKLQEGWAGSLPDTPVSGSEGCVLNKNYDTADVNSYLNPTTGATESKPSSTYSSLSQFSDNWEINDHFIFVKDWQTGIADISLTYDKNNKGYWCGGQYGSRTIYNVQEIIGSTGKCYAVPQSVYLSNVECCFPSDCVNKGAEYTCNPDDWECEKTKPCNSQLECDQVFGEGVCQNNQINQWVCDLTKKWGDYSGTCTHSSKPVVDCPIDCSSKEYYNEEQGKCLPRTNLQVEGADDISGITGASIGSGGIKSMWIIAIVLLVLGGVGVTIYFMKKNKSPLISDDGKCCEDSNKAGKKFCTKCGKKIDKSENKKIKKAK